MQTVADLYREFEVDVWDSMPSAVCCLFVSVDEPHSSCLKEAQKKINDSQLSPVWRRTHLAGVRVNLGIKFVCAKENTWRFLELLVMGHARYNHRREREREKERERERGGR